MIYSAEADLALVRRYTRRRDADAFAEIVRRYAGVVHGTCLRILGDRARAEEVSQETFFRLHQKPEAVTQSLGGWLHRAATQLAIDVVRSDSSRRDREVQYSRDHPRQISRWEELSPLIDEALADLPEDARNLLVRHFLLGRSQTDLAVEMLASPATICRRVAAGLDQLRGALERRGVMAGATIVGMFFANSSIAAAPATLLAELGKMVMVSGARQSLAAATATTASTAATGLKMSTIVLGFAITAIGLLIVTLTALHTPPAPSKPPRKHTMPDARAVPPPQTLPANTEFIVLPGSDSLDSSRLAGFKIASYGDGPRVHAVFGDGHTVMVSPAEADNLLRRQTGRSLADWTSPTVRP